MEGRAGSSAGGRRPNGVGWTGGGWNWEDKQGSQLMAFIFYCRNGKKGGSGAEGLEGQRGHGKWRAIENSILAFSVVKKGSSAGLLAFNSGSEACFYLTESFWGLSPTMLILSAGQGTAQAPACTPGVQSPLPPSAAEEHGKEESFNTLSPSLWQSLRVLLLHTEWLPLLLSQVRNCTFQLQGPNGTVESRDSRMATPITPTAHGPSLQRTSTGSSLCSSPLPWRRTLTSCRCLVGHPSQRTYEPEFSPTPARGQQLGLSQADWEEEQGRVNSSQQSPLFL